MTNKVDKVFEEMLKLNFIDFQSFLIRLQEFMLEQEQKFAEMQYK